MSAFQLRSTILAVVELLFSCFPAVTWTCDIDWKSSRNFSSYPSNRQSDKQTDRQTRVKTSLPPACGGRSNRYSLLRHEQVGSLVKKRRARTAGDVYNWGDRVAIRICVIRCRRHCRAGYSGESASWLMTSIIADWCTGPGIAICPLSVCVCVRMKWPLT